MSRSVLRRGALFLDRDGVINVDHGYVCRPDDFQFINGIFAVVARAVELGLVPVVVTNQAGIARGYYSEDDFERLTLWMSDRFIEAGAPVAAVYHCPYHADGVGVWRVADHPDRKPNPGMLLRAMREHGLAPEQSILVGDQESDVEAARRAGVAAAARFAPEGSGRPDTAADAVLVGHHETLAWIDKMAAELEITKPQLNETGRDSQ
jgi:D-glycero-D-manno-heptose 1,7-bisphosphate phosphatase